MTLNKERHKQHKMPKNPTTEERIIWHIEHSKHCTCRKPSTKLQSEIKNYQESLHNKLSDEPTHI